MDDRVRVTDADRDHAGALLRGHFVVGRLTAGQLDERLTAALRAVTFGDLRRALAGLPKSPVASQDKRVSPQVRLERGYRRLLAFYPAAHRGVHEEEMLAVLMTQAPVAKRRPGIAEAADLLLGALRVRCQPPCGAAEPGWRDALAVLSVILPVLILLTAAVSQARLLLNFPAPGAFAYGFPRWVIPGLCPPARPGGGGPAGAVDAARRHAGSGRVADLGRFPACSRGARAWRWATLPFLALGLGIVALVASPGPRRGLQILTWKQAGLVVIAALAVVLSPSLVSGGVRRDRRDRRRDGAGVLAGPVAADPAGHPGLPLLLHVGALPHRLGLPPAGRSLRSQELPAVADPADFGGRDRLPPTSPPRLIFDLFRVMFYRRCALRALSYRLRPTPSFLDRCRTRASGRRIKGAGEKHPRRTHLAQAAPQRVSRRMRQLAAPDRGRRLVIEWTVRL